MDLRGLGEALMFGGFWPAGAASFVPKTPEQIRQAKHDGCTWCNGKKTFSCSCYEDCGNLDCSFVEDDYLPPSVPKFQ